MKALSVRQPWAWLIVNGHKDIENRNWPTKFRGPILIHASKFMTAESYCDCAEFLAQIGKVVPNFPSFRKLQSQLGGIVGQAEIIGCVPASSSPWFVGEFGFVLRNQKVLPFQPCKGKLGFFRAEL